VTTAAAPLSLGAPADRANYVRASLPKTGLFDGHDWRISPAPFPLGAELAKELESLGRVLLQFNKVVNRLYRLSVEGRQPAWVAGLLDQGKPADLITLQRSAALKNEWPRVIRPDLLITENGLSITELDSVPGGIGLTAWLNQTYSRLGFKVAGGADGMLRGFGSIFGNAPLVNIVISEESATYGPEMAWLAAQLGEDRFKIRDAKFAGFAQCARCVSAVRACRAKTNSSHPAAQAGVRGEDAFRAALEPQFARILASGIGRGFFQPLAQARAVQLDRGSRAAAAACRNSRVEPHGLEPAKEPLAARTRIDFESLRLLAQSLGRARRLSRQRSLARRMVGGRG